MHQIVMRTAIVVAGVGLIAVVAIAAIAVVAGERDGTSWVDLEPGDCFDLAGAIDEELGGSLLSDVDPFDCSLPHDAEIVVTGRLDPDGDRPYPADDELFELADRRCVQTVGGRLDSTRFGVVPIAPDKRTWEQRGGHFACVAVVVGGGTVTVSALD